MTKNRWIVGDDDSFREDRHAPKREAMLQVERKEQVVIKETVFPKEGFKGISIVRVGNVLKN